MALAYVDMSSVIEVQVELTFYQNNYKSQKSPLQKKAFALEWKLVWEKALHLANKIIFSIFFAIFYQFTLNFFHRSAIYIISRFANHSQVDCVSRYVCVMHLLKCGSIEEIIICSYRQRSLFPPLFFCILDQSFIHLFRPCAKHRGFSETMTVSGFSFATNTNKGRLITIKKEHIGIRLDNLMWRNIWRNFRHFCFSKVQLDKIKKF